jgi:hypothetical protein
MEMNKDEVANRNNNKSSAERWQVSEGKRWREETGGGGEQKREREREREKEGRVGSGGGDGEEGGVWEKL